MPESTRLSRYRWAKEHTELTWVSEVIGALVGAGVGAALSRYAGLSAGAAGLIGACGAALIVAAGRFGLNMLRAGPAQHRAAILGLTAERDEAQRRLQALESARPEITLSESGYNLAVTNEGAEGEFRASLEVLQGGSGWTLPPGTKFDGLWSRERTNRARIFAGERDEIVLGGFHAPSGTPVAGMVVLHYFSQSHQAPRSVSHSYPLVSDQVGPALLLRVSIFASPPLRNPVSHLVILRPEGVVLAR